MEGVELMDFGVSDYDETYLLQRELFEKLLDGKKTGNVTPKEYLLIGEHQPVITLGRRAKETNLLLSADIIEASGIKIRRIDRGGDVTYHAPGQLIAYPILDLTRHRLGVKNYVTLLEEAIILLLRNYGIKGERVEGATGVWIDKGMDRERKICAIGIRCRNYCSMHGLALNVNTDLSGFNLINPCGFTDKGVTSMSKERGKVFDMNEIKREFSKILFGLIFPLQKILDFSK